MENHQVERRRNDHGPEDAMSPESLALLVTCGENIRASDRAALTEVRDREWQAVCTRIAAALSPPKK